MKKLCILLLALVKFGSASSMTMESHVFASSFHVQKARHLTCGSKILSISSHVPMKTLTNPIVFMGVFKTDRIVRVVTNTGNLVVVPGKRFYSPTLDNLVHVQNLKSGDELYTLNGSDCFVISTELIELDDPIDMVDIKVVGENYFLMDSNGHGILVHNGAAFGADMPAMVYNSGPVIGVVSKFVPQAAVASASFCAGYSLVKYFLGSSNENTRIAQEYISDGTDTGALIGRDASCTNIEGISASDLKKFQDYCNKQREQEINSNYSEAPVEQHAGMSHPSQEDLTPKQYGSSIDGGITIVSVGADLLLDGISKFCPPVALTCASFYIGSALVKTVIRSFKRKKKKKAPISLPDSMIEHEQLNASNTSTKAYNIGFLNNLFNGKLDDKLKEKSQSTNSGKNHDKGAPDPDPDDFDPKPLKYLIIFKARDLTHVFLNKANHLKNTLMNQEFVLRLVNNIKNRVGVDIHGNTWYGRVLRDGRQAFARVRDEIVLSAGINDVPRKFNSVTGFCKPKP